jgi:hypothetical protein
VVVSAGRKIEVGDGLRRGRCSRTGGLGGVISARLTVDSFAFGCIISRKRCNIPMVSLQSIYLSLYGSGQLFALQDRAHPHRGRNESLIALMPFDGIDQVIHELPVAFFGRQWLLLAGLESSSRRFGRVAERLSNAGDRRVPLAFVDNRFLGSVDRVVVTHNETSFARPGLRWRRCETEF